MARFDATHEQNCRLIYVPGQFCLYGQHDVRVEDQRYAVLPQCSAFRVRLPQRVVRGLRGGHFSSVTAKPLLQRGRSDIYSSMSRSSRIMSSDCEQYSNGLKPIRSKARAPFPTPNSDIKISILLSHLILFFSFVSFFFGAFKQKFERKRNGTNQIRKIRKSILYSK